MSRIKANIAAIANVTATRVHLSILKTNSILEQLQLQVASRTPSVPVLVTIDPPTDSLSTSPESAFKLLSSATPAIIEEKLGVPASFDEDISRSASENTSGTSHMSVGALLCIVAVVLAVIAVVVGLAISLRRKMHDKKQRARQYAALTAHRKHTLQAAHAGMSASEAEFRRAALEAERGQC
jgi:hypothetical protein